MIHVQLENEEFGFGGTYQFTTDAKSVAFLKGIKKKYEKGNKIKITHHMKQSELKTHMRTALGQIAKDLGKTSRTLSEPELRIALDAIKEAYKGKRFWDGTEDEFNTMFTTVFFPEISCLNTMQMNPKPEETFATEVVELVSNIKKAEKEGKVENVIIKTNVSEMPAFKTVEEIIAYVKGGIALVNKKSQVEVAEIVKDEKYKETEVAIVTYADGKKGSVNASLLGRYFEIKKAA